MAAVAPPALRERPAAWQEWATQQLRWAAKASQRLKLTAHATFSGALLWHTVYPWPQRPAGLVEAGFKELGARWRPILDAFDDAGVDVAFEIHPGEDSTSKTPNFGRAAARACMADIKIGSTGPAASVRRATVRSTSR